ncbi:MAG: hypothetical protein ABW042_02310 [Phenylobacterium sp.]
MDLKPGEIALIIGGVAIPLVLLILGFIPGGLTFIGDIAMNPTAMPWLFFGGAGLLFLVLAWRIYRRLRPARKKPVAKAAPRVAPTPKFTVPQRPADKKDDQIS